MNRLEEYNRTWKNLNGVYSQYAKKCGVSVSRFMILYMLYTQPDAAQKELCDSLGMPKQTVSSVITSLEKEGFIETSYISGNKKSKSVKLTAAGRKKAGALIQPVIDAEASALGEIDDLAFDTMIKSYGALKSKLENLLNSRA